MEDMLKVQTKYNENLADSKVVVVTLLSNINRTWDFIVDADAYHTLRLNEDYLVSTQDDWLGTIVGIRFETVANAMNLKATFLKPVPVYDDEVEVLDTTEDELEEEEDESIQHTGVKRKSGRHPWGSEEEDHQLDQLEVEYQWLMADKAAPLKAVHYLWEYKYTGIGSRVIDLQSSIHDLLVLKRFAEDKLVELRVLTAKGVDTYSKFYDNNAHFPLRNPYDDMLRVVLYKGNKEKNKK